MLEKERKGKERKGNKERKNKIHWKKRKYKKVKKKEKKKVNMLERNERAKYRKQCNKNVTKTFFDFWEVMNLKE